MDSLCLWGPIQTLYYDAHTWCRWAISCLPLPLISHHFLRCVLDFITPDISQPLCVSSPLFRLHFLLEASLEPPSPCGFVFLPALIPTFTTHSPHGIVVGWLSCLSHYCQLLQFRDRHLAIFYFSTYHETFGPQWVFNKPLFSDHVSECLRHFNGMCTQIPVNSLLVLSEALFPSWYLSSRQRRGAYWMYTVASV